MVTHYRGCPQAFVAKPGSWDWKLLWGRVGVGRQPLALVSLSGEWKFLSASQDSVRCVLCDLKFLSAVGVCLGASALLQQVHI